MPFVDAHPHLAQNVRGAVNLDADAGSALALTDRVGAKLAIPAPPPPRTTARGTCDARGLAHDPGRFVFPAGGAS